ncbi:polysaccharide pyruvyl transferase family protein [Aquibium sp. ELW1220]|uniref:polysaccharide pyruvyl transferase family protein n=1 Tax=Aquibium sp. ELW1220 TaxID=2976766 RepID=UPI0025B03E9E|nr:polysaccharide pyruvyl transferase family protein [Aquibium sp. ELW1220]MDN2581794.1 polysaccharide pyruvyl transferase family protein [Aquibium sp. ELW1220]
MTDAARQILQQVLGGHASGGRYAIVDYPGYANPGDAAIWCGARVLLEALAGRAPSYVSTLRHFDAARCSHAVAGGTVFFLGGGSFGSLYGKHHRMRLRALEQLRDERIVLLPLSVADAAPPGGDPGLEAETADVLRRCARLTVLAREGRSQALLRDVYGIESALCPDTAHGLTPPVVIPETETVVLRRRDGEARGNGQPAPAARDLAFDWRDDAALRWINRAGKLAPLVPSHRLRLAMFDGIARRKVAVACGLVGRGRIVETDRLHGVILAALMGRTVIVSDNATGKVGSYVETWPGLLPRVSLNPGDV